MNGPPASEDRDDLGRRLKKGAERLPGKRDAVALLIAHGAWLEHRNFVSECTFPVDADETVVDWLHIPQFLGATECSALDAEILQLGLHLATRQHPGRPALRQAPRELRGAIAKLLANAVGPEHIAHIIDVDGEDESE